MGHSRFWLLILVGWRYIAMSGRSAPASFLSMSSTCDGHSSNRKGWSARADLPQKCSPWPGVSVLRSIRDRRVVRLTPVGCDIWLKPGSRPLLSAQSKLCRLSRLGFCGERGFGWPEDLSMPRSSTIWLGAALGFEGGAAWAPYHGAGDRHRRRCFGGEGMRYPCRG